MLEKVHRKLFESKNIQKSTYLWNTAGGMILAFQSVLILVFLTHTAGTAQAGIFTLAYANAGLLLNIGKFGMRSFQVTDVMQAYTFAQYRASRFLTCMAMLAASSAIAVSAFWQGGGFNGYSLEKSLILFLMALFRMADAIEDVYAAQLQKMGRLDAASKAMTLRLAAALLVFLAGTLAMGRLLPALAMAVCCTYLVLCAEIRVLNAEIRVLNEKAEADKKGSRDMRHLARRAVSICRECFPLFAGDFLSFYITAAPKYAIDACLGDRAQAHYGFISMPVFVISLLNGFIFNPMLHRLSKEWEDGQTEHFLKAVRIQARQIAAITAVCMAGAWLCGIPVLSRLYNADLSPYRCQLLILLAGGGFSACLALLSAVITIMRQQKRLLYGYAAAAVFALLSAEKCVSISGITGAALLYTGLMAGLAAYFAIAVLFCRKKDTDEDGI